MKLPGGSVKRLLLPFFPDDKKLRKFWWHKLIKLAAIVVSASSLYTILWMLFLFFLMPTAWMDSPLYPSLFHISYLLAYIPMNFTSFLSSFPIYQSAFQSMLSVPVIGPIALILILIALLYIAPSLLYRLGIYIYQRFHLKRVKVILFAVLLVFGLFHFSTWKYQQLINQGSMIADEQCLKVNPLIIERKNNYMTSMKIILASGSTEDYQHANNKYIDTSKKFVEAEQNWLVRQKIYMSRWDFNLFIPSYVRKAASLQYDSRKADLKATSTLVELLTTYNDIDSKRQEALYNIILEETQKSQDADEEYKKVFDVARGKFDLRNSFVRAPRSKCPPENFDIPDVQDIFKPNPVPVNNKFPVS